jgi:23S rRNA G2445 N2-methylase RlmL
MRDEHGVRPNVDAARPDLAVVLHAGAERASVYVDSSGEALFKRGWRDDKGDAPLKETLAAAMLAAAGWRGTVEHGGALHDPCCGAGTIAIEAAQIAMGLAPGRLRRFAFERLLPFGDAAQRAALATVEGRRRGARPSPRGPDLRQRTSRFAWSTSHAATPPAPASPTRSSSTAATRSSGRRRRCPPSCRGR